MNIPKWHDLANLPLSNEEWASYYPLLFWTQKGKDKALYHLKNAKLGSPILVSSPQTNGRFASPMFSDQEKIHKKQLRFSQQFCRIILAYLLFGTPLLLWLADLFFTSLWTFILLTIGAYERFNYKLFKPKNGYYLEERWQFYSWNSTKFVYYCYPFLGFMVAIGIIQITFTNFLGTNEEYLISFGLIYEKVTQYNEWWRIFTAIFLHLDLAHWLSNALMGTVFFAMCGPTLGLRIVPIALVTATLSFLTAYLGQLFFGFDSDGIIGFSGGIAGVLGYFLSASLRFPEVFPKYHWVTTLHFANLTFLTVSLVLGTGSIITHVSGFLFGIIFGFLAKPISSLFFTINQEAHLER